MCMNIMKKRGSQENNIHGNNGTGRKVVGRSARFFRRDRRQKRVNILKFIKENLNISDL